MDINELKKEEFMTNHINHQRKKNEYLKNVEKADLNNYDINFVQFYRQGKIIIYDKTYSVADLYIEIGLNDENKEEIELIYYGLPNYNILTNNNKRIIKRNFLLPFRDSTCFFNIYNLLTSEVDENELTLSLDKIKKLKEIIYNYDRTIHDKTPETYYKINQK